MTTIITPTDVYDLAFSIEENYNVSVVKESDIAIAESRYLLPVVGEDLYSKLINGGYYDLRVNYVVPMLSAWTRYIVEPIMVERCGYESSAAYNEVRKVIYRRLRGIARSLSRQLSNYLNAHCDEFPEYNPADNPLNHCSIDGDVVQIF